MLLCPIESYQATPYLIDVLLISILGCKKAYLPP